MTITVPANFPIMSFEHSRIVAYGHVAAATLLVWDYLLTVDSEVTLMWPSPWSIMKVLFFWTRYLPVLDISLVLFHQLNPTISISTCQVTSKTASWFLLIGIIVSEMILVIRTWAIWGRSKAIGITLTVCAVLACGSVLYVEKSFLDSLRFFTYPSRATAGCLITTQNSIVAVSFIVVIIFETSLFISPSRSSSYFNINQRNSTLLANNRGLTSVLYRDGILFYVYLFCTSMANFIVILAVPRDLANILVNIQRVLHSCLSARVVLNLREASQQESSTSFISSTSVRFRTITSTVASERHPGQQEGNTGDEGIMDHPAVSSSGSQLET
ncbi:unnamed protein product [Somion occarium]|uniref:DUF6533 domain-containing protein n=1 Tax=Somion occarium TaxID=3059160 RepID=A0ABP1CZW7_9APHY